MFLYRFYTNIFTQLYTKFFIQSLKNLANIKILKLKLLRCGHLKWSRREHRNINYDCMNYYIITLLYYIIIMNYYTIILLYELHIYKL